MLMYVQNLTTGEIEHDELDVKDVIYGADEDDRRVFIQLTGGETLIVEPRENYLIGTCTAPNNEGDEE